MTPATIDLNNLDTIKIAGFKFKVIIPYVFKETDHLMGQSIITNSEIRIADTVDGDPISPENMLESLIHEILHCIGKAYSISPIFEKVDDSDTRAVVVLARALASFLLENNLVEVKYERRK